jgi:hypothetical protein
MQKEVKSERDFRRKKAKETKSCGIAKETRKPS